MSDLLPSDPIAPFQASQFLGYELAQSRKPNFSLAEVVRITKDLLTDSLPGIVVITLVLGFLPGAAQIFVVLPETGGPNAWFWNNSGAGGEELGWLDIVSTIMTCLSSGYIALLVISKTANEVAGFSRYLKLTGPILLVSVLTFMGCTLGLILLVAPGIILAIAWSVATPVLIAEHKKPLQSLGHSFDLTSGHRWQIFFIGCGVFVFSILSTLFGEFLGGLVFQLSSVIKSDTIMPLLVTSFTDSVSSVVFVGVYLHLRFLNDGLPTEEVASVFT